jgi:predicted  nucleic acid-binding Zn-ribbon protein
MACIHEGRNEMLVRHQASRGLVVLAAALAATLPATGAPTPAGLGTASASAVPLQVTLGDRTADLLDISLLATRDPARAKTSGPAARSSLAALRVSGPEPQKAGDLESSSEFGSSDEKSASDVPLSAPGLVTGRLSTGVARSGVDRLGSRASVEAVLADLLVGDGLLEVGSASASMSVEATPAGATALKTIVIPSVILLRVGDLADAAGIEIPDLPLEDLLAVTNALDLTGPADLAPILALEVAIQNQIDAVQSEIDTATAERDDAVAQRSAAEGDLVAAQADLAAAGASEAATQVLVDSLSAQLSAAQAELSGAQSDLALAQGLSLLDPDAIPTLQGLADAYGASVTVSALNFLVAQSEVTAAIQAVVAAAQVSVDVLSAELEAAESELAAAQDAVAAAQQTVDALQTLIDSLAATIAERDEDIATAEAAKAALVAQLAEVVAQLGEFTEEIRTIVSGASVLTIEGIEIRLSATAGAEDSTPDVAISFASMKLGEVEIATDETTTTVAEELLPQIQAAVDQVGSALDLPGFEIGLLEASADSGTADGYRFAEARFTLLRLSVPTPDGGALTLSVGDPEVFAEFRPLPAGGGGGDGTDGSVATGGSGSGTMTGGGGAQAAAPGPALPATGVGDRTTVGIALLALAALGVALVRPRRARV